MLSFDVSQALPFLPPNWLSSRLDALTEAQSLLEQGTGRGGAFTGWVRWPLDYDREELQRLRQAGRIIRDQSEVLVVIGIGGSYLGAKALLDLLAGPERDLMRRDRPQIFFTGNTLSSDAINALLDYVRDRDFSVSVVSKSGTTTETALAFLLFRRLLEEKYGREGARDRIFATTDRQHGALRAVANEEGYATFSVPESIGGRYSVLTAAGLLPLAAAGLDIEGLLDGAAAMRARLERGGQDDPAWQYAAARHALYEGGKRIELLACYEPSLRWFAEWWKQLFGESEGKEGRGLFPVCSTPARRTGWTSCAGGTCATSPSRPGAGRSWPMWPGACRTSSSPCPSAPPTGWGSSSTSSSTPAGCPATSSASIPSTSRAWRPIRRTCSPFWASPATRIAGGNWKTSIDRC